MKKTKKILPTAIGLFLFVAGGILGDSKNVAPGLLCLGFGLFIITLTTWKESKTKKEEQK